MELEDIIYQKNMRYDPDSKCFNFGSKCKYIKEPTIVMDTLHSCYAHALLDSCFPVWWVIDDLLSKGDIENKDIRIFIRKELILEYPNENLPLIDKMKYHGIFQNIIEILTNKPILFEHQITEPIQFQHLFFYPKDDRWQRSPWNCSEYYYHRHILKNEVRFTDEIIYSKLERFRNHIFQQMDISSSPTNELIIIDRKHNRTFDHDMLQSLITESEKNTNWVFKGVVLLEDLSFLEQIKLFQRTRYFIVRHGSSLVNCLWCQPHSVIIEFFGGKDGPYCHPEIFKRIYHLTQSVQLFLNYDEYDSNLFTILSKIITIIHSS